ncbi:hypothetical protein [Halosimplex pelagicum]|uniref:Uncharacterized protein n=1 Tax=Halosimplex pelagicum TaxID=869886 RepID=A0A7D5P9Y9_9EURY|nr:hypothetical protein [Halosimplex pelagicum]QLH82448.1 hypothetical protein HZS54_12860 [Halosimplex pelagicum]QLH82504.1 hypothetical protein HZS54_13165 [Halosimplex pelagicum]
MTSDDRIPDEDELPFPDVDADEVRDGIRADRAAAGEKLARGIALNARLPQDREARLKAHSTAPIVYEMVRQYARENGVAVKDVLEGSVGSITVAAPKLGYTTVAEAEQAQQQLNAALDGVVDNV